MIVDQNGNVTETIKIITHSMGSAFGKGFVDAILKEAKKRGVKGVPISLVADFDPFQAGSLSANSSVFTQEFSQRSGFFENVLGKKFSGSQWLANGSQVGADEKYVDRIESSHALDTFIKNISQLKEGTYIWTGKDWKCTLCNN
jgi:hypothetical protein